MALQSEEPTRQDESALGEQTELDRDRLRRRARRLAQDGRRLEADRLISTYAPDVVRPLDDFERQALTRAKRQASKARRALLAIRKAITSEDPRAYPLAARAINDFGDNAELHVAAARVSPSPERRLHHLRRAHSCSPDAGSSARDLFDALWSAGEFEEALAVADQAEIADDRLTEYERSQSAMLSRLQAAHEMDPSDLVAGRSYVGALCDGGDLSRARRVVHRYRHHLVDDTSPTELEISLLPAVLGESVGIFESLVQSS